MCGRWMISLLMVALLAPQAAAQVTAPPIPSSQPAGAGTGSIVGTVASPGEIPLSEMVVYLQPSAAAAAAAPKAAAPARISQKGARFDPPLLVVTVGQAVEFLNDEDRPVEHNVFSNAPAKRFDLGLYPPGQSRRVTFDKPGPVFLFCSIHRFMDGVVYVCPTAFFSRVSDDGTWRIDDVPAGEYTVQTWQRRRRFLEQSVPVMLEAGQTQTIHLELTKP